LEKIIHNISRMNTQETFVKLLEDGIPMLFTAAKAMPADKFDWKPEETSRSAHQLVVECITMLALSAGFLTTREMPSYEEESARYEGKSVEELEKMGKENAEKLYKAIRAFPDADLGVSVELPWGKSTFFQAMSYPYWNIMWHTGQLNYIQTLYGDTDFR